MDSHRDQDCDRPTSPADCMGDPPSIPNTSTDPTQAKGKRNRGATMMSGLVKLRAEGVKTKIMFDENDNPIGEIAKKFQSYLGTQARSIPIDYPSWKHVPKEVKDRIWETILVKF